MIKKLSLSTALAVATVGIGAFTQSAQAIVLWNWSFATEAGTFETDGEFSDTSGPFTFTIDPDSFEVTSSTEAGAIGADYFAGQPDIGFQWDGTQATQFFRSSGTFTNGANLSTPGFEFSYAFFPGSSSLTDVDENTVASGPETLTPVEPSSTSVPEPSTIISLAMVGGSLLLSKRVKRG